MTGEMSSPYLSRLAALSLALALGAGFVVLGIVAPSFGGQPFDTLVRIFLVMVGAVCCRGAIVEWRHLRRQQRARATSTPVTALVSARPFDEVDASRHEVRIEYDGREWTLAADMSRATHRLISEGPDMARVWFDAEADAPVAIEYDGSAMVTHAGTVKPRPISTTSMS